MHLPTTDQDTHSRPPNWQVAMVTIVLLAIAVGLAVQIWLGGRPIALPVSTQNQLACASYTPSHDGHMLPPDEVRRLVVSDLKILAVRFGCVRTYSVSEGLDEVPKIARGLGLKVMLGLWIGSDASSNDKEIAHGITIANQYSDVVTAVIVGNEVLLRREQTPLQLRALIERVRAGTSAPVTYADVWEFWLRNPDLAQVTSFVTVHILPYWEDNPIGIDRALDHVKNIYAKVKAAFPQKQVVIGETGWPSAGRPRLTATPSLINEARFVREFVDYAARENIPYNLIEAFDQPWKRNQEGTVGGYWGLYSVAGESKFSFKEPVVAQPSWRIGLLGAVTCAVIFIVCGSLLKPRPSMRALVLLAIAGHATGSTLYTQWLYLSTANRTWIEWLATCTWSISGWLAFVSICIAFARWLDGVPLRQPASIASAVRSWGHGASATENSRLFGVFRLLTLFGLAYVSLALVYDGRGRDFPIAMIGLPIAMFALLDCLLPARMPATIENEELLLALCVGFAACYIAWTETYVNLRAMLWSGLCLLFAVVLCRRTAYSAMYPSQGTEQKADATQLEPI